MHIYVKFLLFGSNNVQCPFPSVSAGCCSIYVVLLPYEMSLLFLCPMFPTTLLYFYMFAITLLYFYMFAITLLYFYSIVTVSSGCQTVSIILSDSHSPCCKTLCSWISQEQQHTVEPLLSKLSGDILSGQIIKGFRCPKLLGIVNGGGGGGVLPSGR